MSTIEIAKMIKDSPLYKYLQNFIYRGWIDPLASTLVVCGGTVDRDVLESLSFNNYLITSITTNDLITTNFQAEDAQELSFSDATFDQVIVHAGLHHCSEPHRALCEMVRVCKKTVIMFEAQDSMLVRLLIRLGIIAEYENMAVEETDFRSGGVNNSPVPNYIFRWTEREFEKTILTYDPINAPVIHFFKWFELHIYLLENYLRSHLLFRIFGKNGFIKLAQAGQYVLNLFFRSQGNMFIAVIQKNKATHLPWIEKTDSEYRMKRS